MQVNRPVLINVYKLSKKSVKPMQLRCNNEKVLVLFIGVLMSLFKEEEEEENFISITCTYSSAYIFKDT